ncbi:relaxase/mobilization nuclease domain-containing protein [Agrobacterium burrii]
MATQAIVHVVRRGGARSIKRICSQMEYLTRKRNPAERLRAQLPELQLQFSERHGAGFIPYDELPDWARRWGEQAGNYINGQQVGDTEQDMTSHIIFSLPAGTDKPAAYRAMRKAAEDVFGATIIREGDRGNPHEFDYLTAFHTDKPHPHLHVLVNRKSLKRDPNTKKHEWLKIARRNTRINYAVMRERFAYWAQQEGIDVEATSRLERGIETPSLSNEQFRINARNAVEVREQWDDLTVIAVDRTSQSRSATPEPVAGPTTQRPQGAGSASGQTGGGSSSRPDIATDGNGGTRSPHRDHTPPALAVGAAATASPSSTGKGIEPGNDTAQEETNAGSSGGGSESYSNVIDVQRNNEAGRQRRERIKSRQAVRVTEDAEDDHTRRRIPEPSILDKERSDEIERQQGERIARDRAAREVENAEGDRRRRRVFENSSLPPEWDDAQSVNRPLANEQLQFTFRVTQDDGGGGGAPENSAEPPQETAAQAAARHAAMRARRRGDDLDRVVRTRGQKNADELKRIEDGPVSGRLRSSTRPPSDRSR